MSEKGRSTHTDINIDADRLARLSRLDMSEDEKQTAADELKKMADYTYPRLISEDSALPFSYCASSQQPRDDQAIRISAEEREAMLALSPTVCDGYITVPRIIFDGGEE